MCWGVRGGRRGRQNSGVPFGGDVRPPPTGSLPHPTRPRTRTVPTHPEVARPTESGTSCTDRTRRGSTRSGLPLDPTRRSKCWHISRKRVFRYTQACTQDTFLFCTLSSLQAGVRTSPLVVRHTQFVTGSCHTQPRPLDRSTPDARRKCGVRALVAVRVGVGRRRDVTPQWSPGFLPSTPTGTLT